MLGRLIFVLGIFISGILHAEDMIFYAPFENSTEPAFAAGTKTARCYGSIEYTDGIKGKAVIVGEKNRIIFDAAKNFNSRQGTCSLWVSSVNWLPKTENFVFFISFVAEKDKTSADMLLYKFCKSTELTFLENDSAHQKSSIIKSQIPFWLKKQWHNLVVSWDEKQICLFVDGENTGTEKRTENPKVYQEIILGIPYTSWDLLGNEMTAVDELKIYDRRLSDKEIISEYDNISHDNEKNINHATIEKNAQELLMKKDNNLALKDNGAWIITSSFGDYDKLYENNLIDGDDNTLWQPKENEYPQYLELRWKYPVKAETLVFHYKTGSQISAASINTWNRTSGKWVKIKNLSEKEIKQGKASFPLTKTDRLRLIIEKSHENNKVTLSELEVYGPEQPLVGKIMPYWNSWYVWYPEPDKIYKGVQPRYFRKTFELDDMSFNSAYIQAFTNDYCKIWINGKEVCSGSRKIVPVDVTKLLRKGKNAVAAEANLIRNPGCWGYGTFIAELSINYPGESRHIGTGPDWKSFDKNVESWNNVEYDDSTWEKVSSFEKPPEGVWGKIGYHDTSVSESVELKNVKIEPRNPHPGSDIKIEVVLKSLKPLKRDYFFIFELGEKGINHSCSGDYIVSREIIDKNSIKKLADGTLSIECKMQLPPYTPSGKIPLRIKGYDVKNGIELDFKDKKENVIDQIDILAQKELKKATGKAKIAYTKGQASFVIDGNVTTPFYWRYTHISEPERLYSAEKYGGINIYQFSFTGLHLEAPEMDFGNIKQQINTLLSISPDARIMLNFDFRPDMEWLQKNPEERLITAFGEKNVVSYASKKYRQTCINYLKKLIDDLKMEPYWDKIVGFLVWTCGQPDCVMGGVDNNTWQKDRNKITAGDFNPQAIELFREFLRKKYENDVKALKEAWKKTDVTFENAMPDIKELIAEGKNGNVFRDPSEGRMTFDYAEFLPTMHGNTMRELARFIKKETNWEKMIFVHYGYILDQIQLYNGPGKQLNNNNYDLADMLKDPVIDGYMGAPHYSCRLAGSPMIPYLTWSSFRLNGRMYLPDDDQRHYVAGTIDDGRCRSLRETKAIVRRNIGADICRNFGSWFADMSRGEGRSAVSWTSEKEVSECIGEMNKVYKKAIKIGYESASEIAVIFSAESNKYLDVYYGPTLNNNLLKWMFYPDFFRMGAPFDVYLATDMLNPKFRKDYKLYIMMNTFYLSEEQLRAVKNLKKDGKTILWFYAPGYVNENGLSTKSISELTSIEVEELSGKEQMKATLASSSHPLTINLNPDHKFFSEGFSYPATVEMHPTEFGPRFRIIDSKADIIAKFDDGKGAIAAKDLGTWKSIYSIIPRLDVNFLRNVCRWAGVHIYTEENLFFDANQNFIVLHNGYSGIKSIDIKLPKKATVYDAITNELISSNSDRFKLNLEECETKVFFLKH